MENRQIRLKEIEGIKVYYPVEMRLSKNRYIGVQKLLSNLKAFLPLYLSQEFFGIEIQQDTNNPKKYHAIKILMDKYN